MADVTAPKVRLDRWLWAARFFKTRAQAKLAIEGGKVHMEPAGLEPPEAATPTGSSGRYRPKVSKEIGLGDVLEVRRGRTSEVVVVIGLSERRGTAGDAALLYRETPESVEAREIERARRRMHDAGLRMPQRKPDKRDRRELSRLKQGDVDS
jgi:ribosome-associated heat shock protein Hsp15